MTRATLLLGALAAAVLGAELERELEAKLTERRWQAVTLAELYAAAGQWRQAAAHYEMARRIRADDAGVLVELSRLYKRLGEDKRLVGVYEALSRLQPTSVAWLRELGACHFRLGHREQAEAVWRRILEVQPSRTYAFRYLADIYAQHGLLEKALAACRKALALSPRDEDLRLRLAELMQADGDPLGALAALAQLSPGRYAARSPRALRVRTAALEALKLPADLCGELSAMVTSGKVSAADLAWRAAVALEEAGRRDDARRFFRRVAAEEPDTPRGKKAAEKSKE